MKQILLSIVALGFGFSLLTAQEVDKQLGDARTAYRSGDLQESRFALQQALNEIDKAIGAEILTILPTRLSALGAIAGSDNVTSAAYVGLFVTRNYENNDKSQTATVTIIGDSPMMAGINAILSLPMIASDPNQKRIRVGGYRGLLQRNTDETGIVSWEAQIPVGSTLFTLSTKGIAEERNVTEMLNTIKIDEIAKLTR